MKAAPIAGVNVFTRQRSQVRALYRPPRYSLRFAASSFSSLSASASSGTLPNPSSLFLPSGT